MSILLESETTLKEKLLQHVKGEVRFDKGDLSLYATDASNYRYIPLGVVIPRDREDVIATVNICRSLNVPIVSRGGGTGLAGQTTNAAVIMDMTKYFNRVLEVNAEEKWVRVEPGIVLDEVNKSVEGYGLIVGPDPATHSRCTIGGMIGNNSCGVHAQWAGKMQKNTLELEVMTYQGDIFRVGPTSPEELSAILKKKDAKAEIYQKLLTLRKKYADEIKVEYPQIPRRVSGYNLEELLDENGFNVARALVGSESTLVTVLEAKVKLLEKPGARGLILIGYSTIAEAGDDIGHLNVLNPMGFEAIDTKLKQDIEAKNLHPEGIKDLPKGHAWLMMEFGGKDEEDVKNIIHEKWEVLKQLTKKPDDQFKIMLDKKDQAAIWEVREAALGATFRDPDNRSSWPGWEDAAVPPEHVGDYLRDFQALLDQYDYEASLYGHFGQGCIHCSIDFELTTHQGVENYHRFIKDAAKIVAKYDGSLSGEHGDGQARAELLPIMFGEKVVGAMNEYKKIWDPLGKMNPGKVTHPYSAVSHLRLGEHHEFHKVQTHFAYPGDNYSFAYATQRCVGVGQCRRHEGGTMCPSFKVTHEEKHSTRGRAHLLFEMLKKETLLKPWKEKEVKESLDLCLACKGCKSDCPVSVDMATYKAEFLSHYFKGRPRPIAAYTMGLIFFWNRIACRIPGIVNFFTQTFPFSWIIKALGGITQERDIPKYARRTFRKDFEKVHEKRPRRGNEVIVWVDSFNNYFHPEVLTSLSSSLEYLGFHTILPPKNLCCGRPLYDFGMLDLAKSFLRTVLEKLHDDIQAGVPIVFAEPSCLAVFKDELLNFFPNDLNAKRMSEQCYTLAQFVEKHRLKIELSPKGDPSRLIFHGHCHHKSLSGQETDVRFLSHFAPAEKLETGCCGMAGSFGFERGEKFKVSMQVAESDLLPKIKEKGPGVQVVADGFSCREQVKQAFGYYPKHSAEIMNEAIRNTKGA